MLKIKKEVQNDADEGRWGHSPIRKCSHFQTANMWFQEKEDDRYIAQFMLPVNDVAVDDDSLAASWPLNCL